jgi:hypothetical protein
LQTLRVVNANKRVGDLRIKESLFLRKEANPKKEAFKR